jgi:hypothetical protein
VPIGVDVAEAFDEDVEPVPGVTVLRVGGHFDGSAVFSTAAVRVERELSRGRSVWDERPGVSTLFALKVGRLKLPSHPSPIPRAADELWHSVRKGPR